jgi:hypothetical protein
MSETFKPLRAWNVPSYDPKSGRSASAFGHGSAFSAEGLPIRSSAQINEARAGGQGGAPGVSGMDRTQGKRSHDEMWCGSKVQ